MKQIDSSTKNSKPILIEGSQLSQDDGYSYCHRTTTVAQKTPNDAVQKAKKFWSFVWSHKSIVVQTTTGPRLLYELYAIGNADETPLFYEYPAHRTVEEAGAKSVPIRSYKGEKTKCTVMLSALADGTKLPPFVIFQLRSDRMLPVRQPGIRTLCTY